MKRRLSLDAGVCVYLAFLLLTVPLRWILAVLMATAIHELGHLAAVTIFGGSVCGIRVGIHGAKIMSSTLTPWKTAICILAGPAASLFLMCFRQSIPRIAICGLVQGVFNLLPVGSLDGANLLRIIRALLLEREVFL